MTAARTADGAPAGGLLRAARIRQGREDVTDGVTIRRLDAAGLDPHLADLSDILVDCVEGGASVNFMSPFTRERADAFWQGVRDRVASGAIALLLAEIDGVAAGTVQLAFAHQENQPHRADLAKMLVHRRARRRGVGAALMRAAEDLARLEGRTLLVLDTASGSDAERLYRGLGWIAVGRVPGYALYPDGRPCDATFFYREL
jgi:GNAT superfamily N-acetyltransferase